MTNPTTSQGIDHSDSSCSSICLMWSLIAFTLLAILFCLSALWRLLSSVFGLRVC